MKKGLLGILAVGLTATAANAAQLSLRFAGGGTEVTMGPEASGSATIEVLLTFTAPFDNSAKTPSRISTINARFEVGDLAINPDGGGTYIQDDFGDTDAGKWVVTDTSTDVAGWNTDGASPDGNPFDASYFFAAEDPSGAIQIVGSPERTVVLGSFTIHKALPSPFNDGDTFIAFRVGAALPALGQAASGWGNRFGYTNQIARNQFLFNDGTIAGGLPGNPGDQRPQDLFHGYETLNPLVIHNVPEPSALALLALGGLAMLRRKK